MSDYRPVYPSGNYQSPHVPASPTQGTFVGTPAPHFPSTDPNHYTYPAGYHMPPATSSIPNTPISSAERYSDGQANTKLSMPKPRWPTFKGDGQWTPFFKRFEAVFQQQQIPNSNKMNYLITLITGSAELKRSVSILSQHMATIFDDVETSRQYKTYLTNASQGDLSINAFAAQVSGWAHQAGYNDLETIEAEAGEAFLAGANDKRTASMVRCLAGQQYPDGIPLNIALTMFKQCASDLAVPDKGKSPLDKLAEGIVKSLSAGRDYQKRPYHATNQTDVDKYNQHAKSSSPKETSKSGSSNSQLEQLILEFQALKETVSQLSTKKSDNYRPRSPSPKRNNGCFKCGKLGHYAAECKDGATKPNTCEGCKGSHLLADCPRVRNVVQTIQAGGATDASITLETEDSQEDSSTSEEN